MNAMESSLSALLKQSAALLAILLFAPLTHAVSFDCSKAKSPSEVLICSDPSLSKLDDELAELYRNAKANTADPAKFKLDSRSEWTWRERNCRDAKCLYQWYERRKQQLTDEVTAERKKVVSKSVDQDDAAKIRTTLKQTATASAKSPQSAANSVIGAWRCKLGDDVIIKTARFPDGKFVSDVLIPSQKEEFLQAGSYSTDGQRYSETWKANRHLRIQLRHPDPTMMEWRVSAKSASVITSNYKTREYQLTKSGDNQQVLRLLREVNWDGRDSSDKTEDPIHCVRADQFYKELEAIRAGIPPQLL